MKKSNLILIFLIIAINIVYSQQYPVIDTGQDECYDTLSIIECPQPGQQFYGQDSQFDGTQFSFIDNGDETVTDMNTGLIWQQFLFEDKFTFEEAITVADTFSLNSYTDWRLPSIKELYSLIDFRGVTGIDESDSKPFIDTSYFEFRYGDINSGERFIDAQYVSSTQYTGTTMDGNETVFGVNFADGRIKGYPSDLTPEGYKLFELRLVRGNTNYGVNDFTDNNDGTITDNSTGLMWSKYDNGTGLNWQEALEWAEQKNQEKYLGYNDWRLPDAKELQSIVDYTRSPQATNSPAINPVFSVTEITDEGGNINYPFYWSGTTHADGDLTNRYIKAAYIAFGEALGFMEVPPNSGNYVLMDVHGAGAQRSDPKQGDPDNFPHGFGPQGDVIRIYNFVRLVRNVDVSKSDESSTLQKKEFTLAQNYPNPFNPVTEISFSIPAATHVRLKVFNIIGQEVEVLLDKYLPAGEYSLDWNAEEEKSGVYFYRLTTDLYTETRKMILMR